MDPLTIVSLAANIIQFVEFSYKLVTGTYDIAQSSTGRHTHYEDVDTVAQSVKRLHEHTFALSGASLNLNTLSRRERNILPLREACVRVGNELIGHLDQLKLSGVRSRWKTMRAALLSLMKEQQIKELENRLFTLQSQIDSVLISDIEKQQAEVLQLLQKQIRSSNQSMKVSKDLATITENFEKCCMRLEGRFDAIEKFVSGTSRQGTKPSPEEKRLEVCKLGRLSQEAQLRYKQQCFLARLDYDMRTYRAQTIKPAHKDTFQWIFQNKDKSPSQFRKWLVGEDGIFWITGKPGSGKSTLIKYLWSSAETYSALEKWTQGRQLVTAFFYFWHSGTIMQRSLQGLLRSLIVQVLDQFPELILKVFPDEWEALENSPSNDPGTYRRRTSWTTTELLNAIRVLATTPSLSANFCFFIDGLDEYDGSDKEMVDIIASFEMSHCFKLCLSSRPHAQFKKAYGQNVHRSLSVSSLTADDIRKYVHDKLSSNTEFQILETQHGTRCQQLVDDVVRHASGVFLWVYLVVDKLLEGIEVNNDRMSDLEKKLGSIPKELDQLFRLILDSVDSDYHEAQAHMLRVACTAEKPLDLLAYYCMDTEDAQYAFQTHMELVETLKNNMTISDAFQLPKKSLWTWEDTKRMEGIMSARVDVRCKGLLEVIMDGFEQRVYLIHRTLRDFLTEESMSALMRRRSAKHFDAYRTICLAMLAKLKLAYVKDFNDGDQFPTLELLLVHALASETMQGTSPNDILDKVARTLMKQRRHMNDKWDRYFKASSQGEDDTSIQSVFIQHCAAMGLSEYPLYYIRSFGTSQNDLNKLLSKSIPILIWNTDRGRVGGMAYVQQMLEFGADPNVLRKIHTRDFFEPPLYGHGEDQKIARLDFIKLFLDHGASIHLMEQFITQTFQRRKPAIAKELLQEISTTFDVGRSTVSRAPDPGASNFKTTSKLESNSAIILGSKVAPKQRSRSKRVASAIKRLFP
ncbi:hypothetical protein N0V90_012883 [Kalmusia sp. IMI 367209]|nr:hypothetical protein N0V90_012883 [Kalmusia sp. IMI 367209]